jgi:thiol:disulfide interchange protein
MALTRSDNRRRREFKKVGALFIRRFTLFGLAAVLICMAAGLVVASEPAHASGKSINWNDRGILWLPFARGLREARHSGKPVLVVFYAEWCRYCAAYGRQFHDPRVVRLSNALVMVRVDVDQHPEIANRYSPDGRYVPRTMVLRPNGTLITSIHGSQEEHRYNLESTTPDELISFMRRAAELNSAPR